MEPFRIEIPDAVLDDLRHRLAAARIPERTPGEPWSAGTDPDYLRELVEYWAEGFDWRAKEEWLAGFPQFLADVGGQTVHFAHVRGVGVPGGPPPLPLVVTHGWPYSFADMLPLVPLLADPGAHGGDPADAFDVVVPSLPGYAWSSAPEAPVIGPATADVWAGLMALLGYERFGTYGEDVGAGVSDWLAARHPERVIGIHAAHPAYPPEERKGGLSEEETAFYDWLKARWDKGEGYSAIQSTRPDTLAAALLDSPSGLAAWLAEKFRAWSDGDRFTYDDILTTVTLYWVTGTIGTSFRPYHDERFEPPLPVITVPAGITISRADLGMPRSLAERTYADIRFWNELAAGGHFVAKEEPGLVAADVRAFFRGLR